MHCPTTLVAPFCTIESPAYCQNNQQKQSRIDYQNEHMEVPEFRVVKSSSILNAVKGLTVIVAAYSIGESLLILCQTLWSLTT